MDTEANNRSTLIGIQFARAVAAIMVVLYHGSRMLPQYVGGIEFGPNLEIGYAGVDFFFVLSGFIIYRVHAKDIDRPSRLGRYAFRRISRIYPIYWIAFALALAILIARKDATLTPSHVLSSFFLIPESISPVLGVAWTLCHEVAFYAAFAVLILSRKLGLLVILAWSIFVLVDIVFPFQSLPLKFVVSSHHFEFAMGAGAAYLSRKHVTQFAPAMIVLGIAAFLALSALQADEFSQTPILGRLLYGSISTWIIYALAVCEEHDNVHFPDWAGFLGAASYSLYLFHIFLLGWIGKISSFAVAPNTAPVALFLAVVVATIAVGCFIYYFVERPLTKVVNGARIAVPGRAVSA